MIVGESEFVASEEVGNEEASCTAVSLVAGVLTASDGDLLHTLTKEKHSYPAGSHHVEVHGAGGREAQGTVRIEDAHRHAEDLSHYHF